MRRGPLVLLAVLWLLAAPSRAAPPPPATATATATHLRVELLTAASTIAPKTTLDAGLRFTLEPGWHLYWQNPGDSGEAPSATFRLPDGVSAAPLQFPVPHRIPTGPLVNYGYERELVLLAPLSAAPSLGGQVVRVAAEVRWLVCSEECIPGRATLERLLTVGSAAPQGEATAEAQVLRTARAALPQPPPPGLRLAAELLPESFVLTAAGVAAPRQASLLPLDPDRIDNAAPQVLTATASGFTLRLVRSEQLLPNQSVSMLRGLLVLEPAGGPAAAFRIEIPVSGPKAAAATKPPAAPAQPLSLGWALLLALLGGALLNLMPCVFPVLSIKVLSLVQLGSQERRHAALSSLAYSAGVLVSFWLMAGALLLLRGLGHKLGWGFQLQSPRFVLALAALLFLLGLSLLGVFDLGLGLTAVGQSLHGRKGHAGAFATGILAVVLATPCTAPFMGSALGFALTQPTLGALSIFTALGLGLALPYLLLVASPGLLRRLPRPGAWMETFKQLMGFLLAGTVVWLAWVLGVQAGVEAVISLLVGLLLVGLAAWLLGRYREGRAATAAATVLVLAGALGPGLLIPVTQPVDPVSGAPVGGAAGTAARGADEWQPFSPELVERYRAAGTPVFVDFTAAWCVSCKVNERLVLSAPAVQARFKELGVALLKADWTRADPVITDALRSFGRSGVPCYVLYGRDPTAPPVTLPEVLSPGLVLGALDRLRQPGEARPPAATPAGSKDP
ncbi:MAG: protein-disulfide reductase DsbD family protein [Polyangia bacterium]